MGQSIILENKWMLIPLFIQFLLTMLIYQINTSRRVRAVKEKKVQGTYFKTFEGDPPPRDVLASGQLILNLFEMPVLFFTIALLIIIFNVNDTFQMIFSGLYVFFRLWHAYIKITNGHLVQRAFVFTASTVFLTFMWFWFMIKVFL
ncbi:MAG: MAPEG family protein [Bdellovibrionota bacterium]|nr:MAPEG family protein [Bdellovibrionota bacterium]